MASAPLGRILIVDDESPLMDALVDALTAYGYLVKGFLTGIAAIEALQAEEFDILLTDLMMPGMDGIALLRACLAIDPNLIGIIMTGQGTVPTAVEAMKTGAFDYVLKPFRLDTLLPMLVRAIEIRRLRSENIQLRETVAIYDLSQTIALSLDSKLVLEKTADTVMEQMSADEASIMLINPAKQYLSIAAVRGKEREHLLGQERSPQEGIAGWVTQHVETLILNGEVSDSRFAPIYPRSAICSAISMPMLAAGKLVGILNVNSLQAHHQFTSGQVKALSILANTAATALENDSLFKALEASEKRFRSLIEKAPDGIALLDLNGKLRQVTPSTEKILGYTLEEAEGQDPALLTHPDDLPAVLMVLNDLIQNPSQAASIEYRFLHKNGSWRWLESTITNLIAEPSVEAIVFNYRDITERKLAEAALRESERQMAALVTSLDDIIFEFDIHGIYLHVWSRDESLLARPRAELIGRTIIDVLGEEAGRPFVMACERVIESGRSEDIEYSLNVIGGKRWFLSRISPIIPADGNSRTASMVIRDITDRKQVEEALRDSEMRYRLATRATQDVIWEWNSKTKQLIWSENASVIFGYSPEEIHDATWWDNHLHHEDRQRITSQMDAVLSSGETIWSGEYRFLLKNGSYAYISDHGYVERDSDGNPTRMIGAMSDITERKRAEDALRESETRFRSLIENGSDEISIVSRDGSLLYESPSSEPTLGYEPGEFLGQNLLELVHPEDQERVMQQLREILKDPTYHPRNRFRLLHRNGTWRWVEAVGTNLIDQPSVGGIVINYHDVTDRVHAEQALRESEIRFRGLFENTPVSIWEEDFSALKTYIDDLKEKGVGNLESYFDDHPEVITTCLNLVKLLDVNRTSLKLHQATTKTELLKNLRETFEPESYETFKRELLAIANGEQSLELDVVLRTLTGQQRDVTMYWSVVQGNEQTYARVLVSLVDITERKKAEEALHEKERLLSDAQRIGHIGSWSYRIDSDLVQFSDEMYRLFDILPEECQHNRHGFLNLIYSADRPRVDNWLDEIHLHGQAKEVEFRIFRKSGELCHIYCQGAVEFNRNAKPTRIIATAQDVTERKLAEIQIRQQLEHLRALRKIDEAITSSFNLQSTLDVILSQVISQLQVDAADVLLAEDKLDFLTYAVGKGFHNISTDMKEMHLPAVGSHAGRVIKQRQLLKIPDLKEQPFHPMRNAFLEQERFVCYFGVPLITKRKVMGVLELFHRMPLQPYDDWLDFLNTLAGQAAIAIDNAHLFENLQRSNKELMEAYDATIEGWSRAMDLRDKETEGHTQRVTDLTLRLASVMKMSESDLIQIRRGALLHDMGKLGVPDQILLKPGKLTEEDWVIMKKHPQFAYEMLSSISYLKSALSIPYCHHEKWDGTGYPRGLRGEQIPPEARLFAVVDVWDAVTSDRPYRKAWSKEEALQYIRDQSGKHFDPDVVNIFLNMLEQS